MHERKTKHHTVINPRRNNNHQQIPEPVGQIAREMGLALEGLLDWKVYPSGKVVLIAPNGMKFVVETPPPEDEKMIKPSIKGKNKTKAAEVSIE